MAKMGEKTFASSHFCGKWNMGKRGKETKEIQMGSAEMRYDTDEAL